MTLNLSYLWTFGFCIGRTDCRILPSSIFSFALNLGLNLSYVALFLIYIDDKDSTFHLI